VVYYKQKEGFKMSYFNVKLKDILHERNISQKELAEMTGLREATISELANNTRTTLNKAHIIKIMQVLDLKELGELIEVHL
jgi:putative transcriptional regulator